MVNRLVASAMEHPWLAASCTLMVVMNGWYMVTLRKDPPNPLPIILMTGWVFLNSGTYREFAPTFLVFYADLQKWTIITMLAVVVWKTYAIGWETVRHRLRFNWVDTSIAVIVPIVFLIWKTIGAEWANWVGQIAAVLAFIPFMKQAWVSRYSMSPWPWILGAGSYGAQVLASLDHGFASLVFPAVGFLRYLPILAGLYFRRRPTLSLVTSPDTTD